ncbi:hypothetical protein EDB89DRAFT_483103 [Lactarius sanguifluus]|nr:hypothetical protein EDB89DRAFT_483103 [Lactarius sanguifluus]
MSPFGPSDSAIGIRVVTGWQNPYGSRVRVTRVRVRVAFSQPVQNPYLWRGYPRVYTLFPSSQSRLPVVLILHYSQFPFATPWLQRCKDSDSTGWAHSIAKSDSSHHAIDSLVNSFLRHPPSESHRIATESHNSLAVVTTHPGQLLSKPAAPSPRLLGPAFPPKSMAKALEIGLPRFPLPSHTIPYHPSIRAISPSLPFSFVVHDLVSLYRIELTSDGHIFSSQNGS